jgi:hypothetical protein
MSQNNPEICSLINDSCPRSFDCGICPIAWEYLSQKPDFKDIHNTKVKSFSSGNRTAILFTPDIDPQNNPNHLILASVRNGNYQQLITRSELSHLKKGQ